MLNIGVLIIGSLYWDNKAHRTKWRRERLDCEVQQRVNVPIRYGRLSSSRGNSYTMVFSTGLAENEFGRAIVIPCKSHNLVEEAKYLWRAEQSCESMPSSNVSAKWGCVALIENPERPIANDLRNRWTTLISESPCYGRLNFADNEDAPVDESGFLNIRWPRSEDCSDLEVDVLLATATDPTIKFGCYPTAREIAQAWNTPFGRKHIEYFNGNRQNEITTFQDATIESILKGLREN